MEGAGGLGGAHDYFSAQLLRRRSNFGLFSAFLFVFFSCLIINHHMRMCGGQITGKALMLDEIINYVQSLQRQVEVPPNMQHVARV